MTNIFYKIILFLLSINLYALDKNINLLDLDENKRNNEFLQLIWESKLVNDDIEAQTYLTNLGLELANNSKKRNNFSFFLINNNSVNAFAGPNGHIGIYTGLLLKSDTESELAAVLAHEIAHVNQNHIDRFDKKIKDQLYILIGGMLLSSVAKKANSENAISISTIAGIKQQQINFIREHEIEADRIGMNILHKSRFDPSGMASFFQKLTNDLDAKEFLSTHPLSVNRVADSMILFPNKNINYKKSSFQYLTTKIRIYYEIHKKIEKQKNKKLNLYSKAYLAFKNNKYEQSKQYIDDLLKIDTSDSSYILAGRIYSKLQNIKDSQQYFSKVKNNKSSVYYSAQAYLDNNKPFKAISLLKSYLKTNNTYKFNKLLSSIYLTIGKIDRAHFYNAKSLALQGRLNNAIIVYKKAKLTTNSKDLFDIITFEINRLQNQ